jgi:hypothetical protein
MRGVDRKDGSRTLFSEGENNSLTFSPLVMGKLPRYGRLVVWEKIGEDCVVQCDCGSPKKVVAWSSLKSGATKSCGCLRRELRKKYTSPVYVLRNMVLARYRSAAHKRGLEWTLTNDQCNILVGSVCHYCGSSPSALQTAKWTNVIFAYNGLDRKDNALGYTTENTVACCKLCSHAKAAMSYSEFIAYLVRAEVIS